MGPSVPGARRIAAMGRAGSAERTPHGNAAPARAASPRRATLAIACSLALVAVVSGSAEACSSTTRSLADQVGVLQAVHSIARSGKNPASVPLHVCGSAALLTGPSKPPSGAVTIPRGTNASFTMTYEKSPTTTYWFAPGVHTFGRGQYDQMQTDSGDSYIGAPGAIITGQGDNDYAFTEAARGVTIEYLTIRRFIGLQTQIVVNHTSSSRNWTIEHDTIETTTEGAGVGVSSGDHIEYDCLTHNAQYGFSASGGATTFVLSHNEISYNNGSGSGGGRYDQGGKTIPCGCSGGGKFWTSRNGTVTTNWIHDNGGVGIWVDTDNRGFDISGNYIDDNYAEAIIYEISYNAVISDNTLVDNGWADGPRVGGFPLPAIYISESGGDSRVTSNYKGELEITDNVFLTNWGGVVLWENANRYCGDGSDHVCTLVTRATYTITSCKAHIHGATPTQVPDYYDNCRWKTKTVSVTHNSFSYTPTKIPGCSVQAWCGFNGLFSEYGSTTPWKGWVVATHISNHQNNRFALNTYTGPWHFDGFSQGEQVTPTEWSHGFTTAQEHFTRQDAGSGWHRGA